MENKYFVSYFVQGKKKPVEEFILGKPKKVRAKIDAYLSLLETYGYDLKRPHAAYLRGKIWELRPGIAADEIRMFYFWIETTAVFVHAVDKKDFTQKDIDLAEKRMKIVLDSTGGKK